LSQVGREARAYVEFVENHRVKVVKHEEKNVNGILVFSITVCLLILTPDK
jgi:hypothetical protein